MPNSCILWICLIIGQICLFLGILVLTAHRIFMAKKEGNIFMFKFFTLTFVYIFFQMAISAEQLFAIISYEEPQKNVNMVLAMNIFCIILDLHIQLILNYFWQQTSSTVVQTLENTQTQTSMNMRLKQILTFLWLLCYASYFIYLCIAQGLTIKMDNNNIFKDHPINKIILYIICQSISGFILLLCLLWQAISWRRLETNIKQFTIIIKEKINTFRIKTIFWTTSIFNFFRTLFIVILIVLAYHGKYDILIITLNIYIVSSIVPQIFYLFGFKIKLSTTESLIRNSQQNSRQSKKTQSHQTQLSCRQSKE